MNLLKIQKKKNIISRMNYSIEISPDIGFIDDVAETSLVDLLITTGPARSETPIQEHNDQENVGEDLISPWV